MPKVYYYTDKEIGSRFLGPDGDRVEECRKLNVPHPRFVWYKWPGFETTTNPAQADVFVIRQRLNRLTQEQIRSLPYLKGDRAERHVFFDLADNFEHYDLSGAISIRAACTRTLLKHDPNIIPWPWPSGDFGHYISLPKGGFKYDVVFQGQPGGITTMVLKSVENSKGLNSYIHCLPMFFGYLKDPKYIASLRESYPKTLQMGRLALSPCSICRGAVRYRVYEAMSMARVSVHLCDECVLPLASKIDWPSCLIQLPERDAPNVGAILENWLCSHSDKEIIKMGQYAREVWKKWLWRERWGEVIGMLIKERLELT